MSKRIVALIPDKDVKSNIWQGAFQNVLKQLYYHNTKKLKEGRRCSGRTDTHHKLDFSKLYRTWRRSCPVNQSNVLLWGGEEFKVFVGLRSIWVWSNPKCCIQCTKVMWPAGHIELGHYWTLQTPSHLSVGFFCATPEIIPNARVKLPEIYLSGTWKHQSHCSGCSQSITF